jgi:[NiFe] hydrogenase diaphorase moiety small subunit
MATISFNIDGKLCPAEPGQSIMQAAADSGVYIPALCSYEGLKPAGSCRLCTVRVGGRNMAACHTPVSDGMIVENMVPELEDMRKAIVEMLFVEGNHMCPSCEKSGNCELQAMGYRYRVSVPRFPYLWPKRDVDASSHNIFHDSNRCIKCQRCIRGLATKEGFSVFGLVNRGGETLVRLNHAAELSDEKAEKAMRLCPVGAIIRKEIGFVLPVGRRRFDTEPIGSDVERRAK